MNTVDRHESDTRLTLALTCDDPSTRLRAALAIGSVADAGTVELLIGRCGVEADFFVRDMLTWALCRAPADLTVPRLLVELDAENPQARSQALHTLSKIGDPRAWPAVSRMVHDTNDEVARAAWRSAIALVPTQSEGDLAVELARELGRGDEDLQRSLSRALIALGDVGVGATTAGLDSPDPRIRAHAHATKRLHEYPDSGFAVSLFLATGGSTG
ncbi:HEAT repeat domain-containing protein [Gordonia sp. NPDC003424]